MGPTKGFSIVLQGFISLFCKEWNMAGFNLQRRLWGSDAGFYRCIEGLLGFAVLFMRGLSGFSGASCVLWVFAGCLV